MGDFDDAFVQALKIQSWSLYSVGMFIIAARIFARIKRLGIRNLQLDDYLMIVVAGLYTALVVCLNVISQGGGSNLYPPELSGTFTPEQVQERIYGSKIVVVSEQAMLNVIYAMKACMLIMYTRLTLGLTTQKMVRYLAIYVLVGWLATEIAFFTACRPFPGYWAMPPPDPQCTTLEHYALVQGCLNISSDVLMLFIPVPLVLRMRMAWRQKVVLLFIFSMGLFVIVAAMLTKIFNLTNVWDPSYMLWYVREASVAVYVTNLPMIWPLMREWFPCLRTLTPAGTYGASEGSRRRTTKKSAERSALPSSNFSRKMMPRRRNSTGTLESYEVDIELKSQPARQHVRIADGSSSTEEIVRAESSESDSGARSKGIHVTVERTVVVQEESRGRADYDVEKGIFGWESMGSDHRFNVAARK